VARYRGAVIESSNDSLASSSSIGSTRDSGSGSVSGSALGNGTETLPCGNREVILIQNLLKAFVYRSNPQRLNIALN